MEHELEEEEEVDPRIQVGRTGVRGAPRSRPREAAAEVGVHTSSCLQPPVQGEGSGPAASPGSWGAAVPACMRPGWVAGIPADAGQDPGVAAARSAVRWMCNKGKGGGGAMRVWGVPGPAPGIARPHWGVGRRERPPSGRRPPRCPAGTAARRSESSPFTWRRYRPEPSSSFDSLLPNGRVYCVPPDSTLHLASEVSNLALPCCGVLSVNGNQEQLMRKAGAGRGRGHWPGSPHLHFQGR